MIKKVFWFLCFIATFSCSCYGMKNVASVFWGFVKENPSRANALFKLHGLEKSDLRLESGDVTRACSFVLESFEDEPQKIENFLLWCKSEEEWLKTQGRGLFIGQFMVHDWTTITSGPEPFPNKKVLRIINLVRHVYKNCVPEDRMSDEDDF